MLKHIFCTVVLCCISLYAYSNSRTVNTTDFIDMKSQIAVAEMYRTGIPASITIAQSIVESSWGRGQLALEANNYFGIKCKKDWTGETAYVKDDDYKNGKLVESCFRAYDSIEESFRDHSDFLVDNPRYAALFELNPLDYKGWAKGLKKAGYATDKKYAEKLIAKIEEYQLYKYDTYQPVALNIETGIPATNDNHTIAANTDNSASAVSVPEAFVLPDDYVPNYYSSSSENLTVVQMTERNIQPTANRSEPMPAISTEAERAQAPGKPKRW